MLQASIRHSNTIDLNRCYPECRKCNRSQHCCLFCLFAIRSAAFLGGDGNSGGGAWLAWQLVCFRIPPLFCCVIENLNLFCTGIQILFLNEDPSPKNNSHLLLCLLLAHNIPFGCGWLFFFAFVPDFKR